MPVIDENMTEDEHAQLICDLIIDIIRVAQDHVLKHGGALIHPVVSHTYELAAELEGTLRLHTRPDSHKSAFASLQDKCANDFSQSLTTAGVDAETAQALNDRIAGLPLTTKAMKYSDLTENDFAFHLNSYHQANDLNMRTFAALVFTSIDLSDVELSDVRDRERFIGSLSVVLQAILSADLWRENPGNDQLEDILTQGMIEAPEALFFSSGRVSSLPQSDFQHIRECQHRGTYLKLILHSFGVGRMEHLNRFEFQQVAEQSEIEHIPLSILLNMVTTNREYRMFNKVSYELLYSLYEKFMCIPWKTPPVSELRRNFNLRSLESDRRVESVGSSENKVIQDDNAASFITNQTKDPTRMNTVSNPRVNSGISVKVDQNSGPTRIIPQFTGALSS